MTEISIQVLGFDDMKHLYETNPNFFEPWRMCRAPFLDQLSKWEEYFIQEGMLFEGIQLCILRGSMGTNLIKEKHSSGLVRHFGIDKTLSVVKE